MKTVEESFGEFLSVYEDAAPEYLTLLETEIAQAAFKAGDANGREATLEGIEKLLVRCTAMHNRTVNGSMLFEEIQKLKKAKS